MIVRAAADEVVFIFVCVFKREVRAELYGFILILQLFQTFYLSDFYTKRHCATSDKSNQRCCDRHRPVVVTD